MQGVYGRKGLIVRAGRSPKGEGGRGQAEGQWPKAEGQREERGFPVRRGPIVGVASGVLITSTLPLPPPAPIL